MKFAARGAPHNGDDRASAPRAGRDAELVRLEGELRASRARESAAREETRELRARFEQFRSMSRNFAASVRESTAERTRSRRRIAAQYAVGRVLAEAEGVEGAAREILRVLVRDLGWDLGLYWSLDGDELRCRVHWPAADGEGRSFEGACRDLAFRRGEGLPGRAWAEGGPVCVEDLSAREGARRQGIAREAGLRSALAFPVRDAGRTSGVFELFGREAAPPDQEMTRVAAVMGGQIGHFAERRRAEADRERSLACERATRAEAEGARRRTMEVLESIGDAFASFDRDWRFTYVNNVAAAALRRLGRAPEALQGKVVWEEVPGLLGTKFETETRRALREGEVVEYEEYFRPLDAWLGARVYPSEGGVSTYVQNVTERRRAREALERNEERWRALIDKGSDVITISDRDGTVRFASPSIETICGHPVDEFVGTNPFGLGHFHPEDLERCEAVFRELADEPGRSITIQHRYRHGASGEWRWLEGTFTNLFDDAAIGGLVANFRDVTERKEAEELLRDSEERFRAVANLVPDLLWRSDPSGRTEWCNERWLEYTGQSVEEALGHGWLEAVHPDDRERSRADFQGAVDAGEPFFREHRIRAADGSYRWFLLRAEPIWDDEGHGVRWFGTATDVHEQRTVLEALRENEEWLGLAQRAADSGTWDWDLQSGEIRWSRAHRDLFGLGPSDEPIELGDWWDAIHPDDLPRIEEAGRRCFEEDEEWPEVEYRIFRDDGFRWIAARGRTEKDASGRAVRILGISTDVTARKEAEEERDKLLAREWVVRAEVAERVRISRELHDRVAHSMGVAHQSLQLYEVFEGTKPSQAAAKLRLAKEMTQTALESTRNLSMELRRSEAEEGLVPALEDLLKVAVPPGIRAELRADGEESRVPPHVRGQLFSILREGVRNAVKHSGAGHVLVEFDVTPKAIVCGVEDDGGGFGAEDNGQGGGNGAAGVGLRSMRERVGLLGGEFRLSSRPGEGTRIEVTVPLNGGE